MVERVAVYIDGFNLYYGIKNKGWRRYLWLDIHLFSQNLLPFSNQRLEKVRYFTSYIFHDPDDQDKKNRQKHFIRAIAANKKVCICYGSHRQKKVMCRKCNSRFKTYEEKKTDVNIAVKLLEDAQDNLYDTAFLVCGDEDLSGAVCSITRRYGDKQVVVYCPPGRRSESSDLKSAASHFRSVPRHVLAKSQFPNPVIMGDGRMLWKPESWT